MNSEQRMRELCACMGHQTKSSSVKLTGFHVYCKWDQEHSYDNIQWAKAVNQAFSMLTGDMYNSPIEYSHLMSGPDRSDNGM